MNQLILDAESYRNAKWKFEIPPEPIPESSISETISAQIIVVGSGVSGLYTAALASSLGADVKMFSASSRVVARGGSNCGWGSKEQVKRGIEFDGESQKARIKQEIAHNGGRVDTDKWFVWIDNSKYAMNWLIDLMEAEGYETTLEVPYIDSDGAYTQQPMSHNWIGKNVGSGAMYGEMLVVKTLEKKFYSNGGHIDFKTIAKQLVKNDEGRVVAVIAQREDGSFVKYVGTQAVVLATGDFSNDKDMVMKYNPEVADHFGLNPVDYDAEVRFGGLYTGDGHKMALWAGAAWQKTWPNPAQVDILGAVPHQITIGNHMGINLNNRGERFMNEDTLFSYAAWIDLRQPNTDVYYVWDSDYVNFYEKWEDFGCTCEGDRGPKPFGPEKEQSNIDKDVERGRLVKGQTIEEVLQKLGGINVDEALKTIERYNGYCNTGVDEEYHKNKAHLAPIRKAPFYGGKYHVYDDASFLSLCGGLRTSKHMEACDEDDSPIPGLYCVGTMVGDVFANIYNFSVCGMSIGMTAIAFPYTMVHELLGIPMDQC